MPTDSFGVAIVGPGTGLGTGGLLKLEGKLIPLVGEGGHIGFAPKSKTQIEILGVLLMERIPTRLITYGEPGLLGAAHCALELASKPWV